MGLTLLLGLRQKKNYLLEKILQIFSKEKNGTVLDLGCGRGMFSIEIHKLGFQVTAFDCDSGHFRFHDEIKFIEGNAIEKLPFDDSSFDYLLFIETIEHLEKPFEIIGELSRVLKPNGKLIISTPNILNLGSRIRFLFEGCFDFFREPPIDLQEHLTDKIENLHIIPWRYHELEYLLYRQGFYVENIYTDYVQNGLKPLYYLLYPFFLMQRRGKEWMSLKRGGMDFRRINNVLFSNEMLFGKHLILKAVNVKKKGQPFGCFEKTEIKKFNYSSS